MSALSIQPAYPIFTDIDGQPLEDGYVWIGTANLDPQTNPINVYWDAALTLPAAQPIRTLAGYPANSGTPARLYVNSDYSIRVMNKNGSLVYSAPAATERFGNLIDASQITYLAGCPGAVETNVQEALRRTAWVKDFGAVGDGVTDDTLAIQLASTCGRQIEFSAGTYLLEASVAFSKSVVFQEGAVLKIRNGAVATFDHGIEAGWYTIFDTEDDFITDLTINTSVKIFGCPVKADWFAAKVQSSADIKTIPDQTNNLTKAFRAAVGDYIVRTPTQFINEYQQGCIELGVGFYRVDKTLAFGKQTAPTTYYMLGGTTFKGQGVGSSYLVRTDLDNTDYIMFLAFYTAQLTHFEHFTINNYDPDSVTPFAGKTKACIFMQGDSLQINNIWVSGAQTSTVIGAAYLNGVGFQFSSCVDTFFHDLFAEYCVTGVAFHSAIVSGTNLTLFHTLRQGIGLGAFISDYGVVQPTSSRVNISGIQGNNMYNQGMFVLEDGATSSINISDSWFSGFDSEFGIQVGNNFCSLDGGTRLHGTWNGVDIISFNGRTFNVQDGCFLGDNDQAFVINGLTIDSNTAAATGSGVFCAQGPTVFVNLFVNGLSCSDLFGAVINGSFYAGNISISNVTLSRYTGAADAGPSRQLFVIGNGSSAPQLQLYNWTRNQADVVPLTQFGFCGGSAVSTKLYIDINNLYLATRTVSGTYASVQMPTLTAFV